MMMSQPHRLFFCAFVIGMCGLTANAEQTKPNIIFIMADDLGYGDLGCYGQKLIQTPNLDRMASEGAKFRQFYAGCTVCAPSRSVLMTGQHMGHTHIRGNAGGVVERQTLRPEDLTVAELLKSAGYKTGLYGKWGLGDDTPGNTGLPNDQGFDEFYGYLNQRHAHNYYPSFLWRDKIREPLRNVVTVTSKSGFPGGYATKRIDYSHDLIATEAMSFIKRSKGHPFFLYLSLTIPHANNEGTRGTGDGQEVPDYGPYTRLKGWSNQDKGQAAMITRMDSDIGRMFDLLRELGLDDDTVVMFTSDNGPHNEGGHNPERFKPGGPLRGMKRDLYEGGIRVPMIVRWPGKVIPGQTSDHVGYFGDLMATAAEIAGIESPQNIDSISFLPAITDRIDQQRQHDYLYWEFYERGGKQAVLKGKWKAVRMPMLTGRTELYDLNSDLGEANDVAAKHPDIVKQLESAMTAAHTPHPKWKPAGKPAKKQPVPGDGIPQF
jgi:arylsulfatase A-like enzyme